ncbi:hypothetical protein V1264_007690 [Littorina saxatilis]|uniref:Uncharacterized protein n=1 Tax=Littorina saxatilis TaxID=31220 RepID=A0AAN9AWY6_9CAEN
MDFLIAHSGKYDIDRHCLSKSHKDHASAKKAAAGSRTMADFIPTAKVLPEEQAAVRAEAMFVELIVKMNLPLSTADVISKTVKSAFPDSETAQKYQWQCCRKKATAMIHQMSLDIKSTLKARIATGPFCVSTDGSNEQRDKQYPVVITTVGEFGVCTDLLSVPTMGVQSPSTGENIFKLLEKELMVPPPADATLVGDPPRPPPPSVPWQNCMALGCDNAPVMTGHTNGVFGNMKTKQPHLYLSGCPCHLIHRAAQKAASELPLKIDEILVDIYFYFEHSSKRLAS